MIHWLNENSGAVTAVVTAIYALFTVLLWWATKTQANLTARMFEASNRPYVAIEHQSNSVQGGMVSFTFFLANRGTVPAVVTDWRVRATHASRIVLDITQQEREVVVAVFPSANHPMGPLGFAFAGSTPGQPVRVEARVQYKGVAQRIYGTRRVDEFLAIDQELRWRCTEIEVEA